MLLLNLIHAWPILSNSSNFYFENVSPSSCIPTPVVKPAHFAAPGNRADRLARDVVLFRRVKIILSETLDTFTVLMDGARNGGEGPEN